METRATLEKLHEISHDIFASCSDRPVWYSSFIHSFSVKHYYCCCVVSLPDFIHFAAKVDGFGEQISSLLFTSGNSTLQVQTILETVAVAPLQSYPGNHS
jgi:hypothetical protein